MADLSAAEDGGLLMASGVQKHADHEALSFECYLQNWAGKQGNGSQGAEGLGCTI